MAKDEEGKIWGKKKENNDDPTYDSSNIIIACPGF